MTSNITMILTITFCIGLTGLSCKEYTQGPFKKQDIKFKNIRELLGEFSRRLFGIQTFKYQRIYFRNPANAELKVNNYKKNYKMDTVVRQKEDKERGE